MLQTLVDISFTFFYVSSCRPFTVSLCIFIRLHAADWKAPVLALLLAAATDSSLDSRTSCGLNLIREWLLAAWAELLMLAGRRKQWMPNQIQRDCYVALLSDNTDEMAGGCSSLVMQNRWMG